jgi:hypothetical protein
MYWAYMPTAAIFAIDVHFLVATKWRADTVLGNLFYVYVLVFLIQSGLKLTILLPHPPECWDYGDVPPCPEEPVIYFITEFHDNPQDSLELKLTTSVIWISCCERTRVGTEQRTKKRKKKNHAHSPN